LVADVTNGWMEGMKNRQHENIMPSPTTLHKNSKSMSKRNLKKLRSSKYAYLYDYSLVYCVSKKRHPFLFLQ